MTYISGFVVAVPNANRDAYRACAAAAAEIFRDYDAIELVEAWGDKVPEGKVTDFRRAVQAEDDETVVFSWIRWRDKAAADACEAAMHSDERMKDLPEMPFDGSRMIFGGFVPIFEMDKEDRA